MAAWVSRHRCPRIWSGMPAYARSCVLRGNSHSLNAGPDAGYRWPTSLSAVTGPADYVGELPE
jgi:hypothetical protein